MERKYFNNILLEKSEGLKKNNINFYNAIPIFDDESVTIYRDNCCHYNRLGNEIFDEFVANAILESEDFYRDME